MRQFASVAAGAHRGRGRVTVLAAVTAWALAVAGCAGKGTQGAPKPPLTIGISISSTGDFADPGKAAQRGYEIWADMENAGGGILGRRVELKIMEDGSDPDRAAANYEKLISQDHVDLVLGPFSSRLTIPSSQIAAAHGYVFIEPAGGSPKVFAQHLPNLFYSQPALGDQQGAVFANYILSLPVASRPQTAAYPSLDDPFTQPIADQVRALFEVAGIKTVFTQTYAPDADLGSVMAKLVATHPDVVVAATQSEDGYGVVRSLIKLKWAPRWLYVSNGATSPVEFPAKVGKDNVNGIFGSGDWFPGSNASGSATFIAAYLKKYGGTTAEIDNTSVEAYSGALLIELVAKKTGKLDNATIIKSLHTGTWLTPVGDLSWDAYGAPGGSYILFQWIDGKLQSIYPPGRSQHQPRTEPPHWSAAVP